FAQFEIDLRKAAFLHVGKRLAILSQCAAISAITKCFIRGSALLQVLLVACVRITWRVRVARPQSAGLRIRGEDKKQRKNGIRTSPFMLAPVHLRIFGAKN